MPPAHGGHAAQPRLPLPTSSPPLFLHVHLTAAAPPPPHTRRRGHGQAPRAAPWREGVGHPWGGVRPPPVSPTTPSV